MVSKIQPEIKKELEHEDKSKGSVKIRKDLRQLRYVDAYEDFQTCLDRLKAEMLQK